MTTLEIHTAVPGSTPAHAYAAVQKRLGFVPNLLATKTGAPALAKSDVAHRAFLNEPTQALPLSKHHIQKALNP